MPSSKVDDLKKDIDNLAKTFRDSEEKLYERIRESEKELSENNSNIKLVVQKVQDFIDMFEKHDKNEMEKYSSIEIAIKDMQGEIKNLESNYATKEEFNEVSKAVKKGFKYFYMGVGVFMSIGALGTLIMWILDLLAKLQTAGLN